MDFVYFFRILQQKKWTIFLFTLLSAISAFILVYFKKDSYESVAQYATGFTTEKVKLSDGSVAVDIYTLDIKFSNVLETFNSPRVIGMLSYKLMLHDLDGVKAPFRQLNEKKRSDSIYKKLKPDAIGKVLRAKVAASELLSPSVPAEQEIIKYLKLYDYDYDGVTKLLIIRRVEHTDYLDIIFQSEHPELSAFVVNTLGVEFLNYYKNMNQVRNTESANNIQQLLAVQQAKVDSLTNELKIARISQGALDPVEQTKNAMETVKDLQLELSAAQSQYNVQDRLHDSYNERIKFLSASLKESNPQDALALFKKRDDLREQLSRSDKPDAELQRQLNAVEVQIKQQNGSGSGANRATVQAEIFSLQSKIGEAKAMMNAASASMGQLSRLISASNNKSNVSPKTQVEIDAIDRQLEIENNELKTLREKLSLAEGLIRDDPTTNFRQTLIGEPDVKPVPKHKILITGLAGISTCIITILVFLLLAIFDRSIRTPSQFAKLVPAGLKGALNILNIKKQPLRDVMLASADVPLESNALLFKNNMRKLRYELEQSNSQVLLFTSTERGAGKSFVLEALAYSLLLNKKKVLLMDLNFDRNTLTQTFGADRFLEDVGGLPARKKSLAGAALSGNAEGDLQRTSWDVGGMADRGFLETAICATAEENLFILGCRGGQYSPSETGMFAHLDEFIATARSQFDYILMEAAAINQRSDSFELFGIADKVVTVFSAEGPMAQQDYKSVEDMERLGEKNFGVVLNQVRPENINL